MKEGTFLWESTGLPLTYFNWAPGQPDNRNNNEHCTGMIFGAPGKWNDCPCDTKWEETMTMCEKYLPAQPGNNLLRRTWCYYEFCKD